jgi:hypothetical protein
MELPHSAIQQRYISEINQLEHSIESATTGQINPTHVGEVQDRLDTLAKKYQNSETIGRSRYKLYELQALIHYFNGKDEAALDFIDQAIEMRGHSYARAENLRLQLSGTEKQTTDSDNAQTTTKRGKGLVGLEGWLALFIVGLCISIVLIIVNLAGYPSTLNDLSSLQGQAASYVDALTPALWFEIIMNIFTIALMVWVLVLLFQRSQMAVVVTVVFLITNAIFLVVDYAWASSIFNSYNVSQYMQSELNAAAGNVAKSLVAALVWAPYFLVSKRVKATLTE